MEFFNESNFLNLDHTTRERERIAKTANDILRERGTVMYGHMRDGVYDWTYTQFEKDTHTALLINVEPIKRDVVNEVCDVLLRTFDVKLGPDFREKLRNILERK